MKDSLNKKYSGLSVKFLQKALHALENNNNTQSITNNNDEIICTSNPICTLLKEGLNKDADKLIPTEKDVKIKFCNSKITNSAMNCLTTYKYLSGICSK